MVFARLFIVCISIASIFVYIEGDSNMQFRVYGGSFSKFEQDPHAVYLSARNVQVEKAWICGATILNQQILLTAAHCFPFCPNCKMEAYAGHPDMFQVWIIRKIRKYLMHSEFVRYTNYADIGLLLLNRPLPLGDGIKRIMVVTSFPSNSVGYAAGWGDIDKKGKGSEILKRIKQRLVPPHECKSPILKGMMCATSDDKSSYPAIGDSGGGLIIRELQQIGVVSYHMTSVPYITIYTNLSVYYEWIKRKTVFLICNDKWNNK